MESYEKIKKVLALGFMNFLDENKPKDKMCLSNGECADIEKAFNEQDWPRLAGYLDKYTESEDERIRKEIITLLQEIAEDDDFCGTEHCKEYIAYLEKQKDVFENGRQLGIMQEQARQELEGTDEKQKEPKPTEYVNVKLNDGYPVVSSDKIVEDSAYCGPGVTVSGEEPVEHVTDAEMEKGLDELTKFKQFASALSDMYNIIPSHTSLRPKDIDWNNFCAGLLTYLKRNQPAEWSEEDERILKGIIGKIDNNRTYGVSEEEMLSFLKSLRPQPHWKPSEEQIGALNYAYCELFKREDVGHNILGPLQKLLDYLKKLM